MLSECSIEKLQGDYQEISSDQLKIWLGILLLFNFAQQNQGRRQGGPGVPVAPLLQAFFMQTSLFYVNKLQ